MAHGFGSHVRWPSLLGLLIVAPIEMGYYFVPPVRQQGPTSPGAARGYWPLDFSRVSLELSPTGRVSVGTLSTQASRVRKQIVMIVEHRSAAISKMAASRTIVPPELRSGLAFNFVVGTEVRNRGVWRG